MRLPVKKALRGVFLFSKSALKNTGVLRVLCKILPGFEERKIGITLVYRRKKRYNEGYDVKVKRSEGGTQLHGGVFERRLRSGLRMSALT